MLRNSLVVWSVEREEEVTKEVVHLDTECKERLMVGDGQEGRQG